MFGRRGASEVRAYTDAELAEHLGAHGIPLEAYMLIGEPGADLPALYLPEIGFRYTVIEIDELARACKLYLAPPRRPSVSGLDRVAGRGTRRAVA
jgi:hypothetical protein